MALTQITYTNKETLNEQPSIADKNKVKSADMNEIKSVVNTNASNVGDLANLNTTANTSIVAAINELKGGEVYSISEVKTNKVWIDGKPIYSKTYYENFNASTSGVQSKTIDLNINNTNLIWVDYQNSFYLTINDYNLYTSVPIDFCNGTSASARINNYFRSASTLRYALDIYGMRAGTAYVTFLYTKTTD